MANEDQDLELDIDASEEPTNNKKSKKLIVIGAVVLLVVAAALAAYLMLAGEKSTDDSTDADTEVVEEVPKGPAIYVGVPEALTSNIPGTQRSRTIQIKMSFMVRSGEAEMLVKTHMPQLKNDVLMLISQQSADELQTPEGRIALQQKALETVQATLTDLTGVPTIEKVLFISFVMQ